MWLQISLVTLDKSQKNYMASSWNNNHIKVQIRHIFQPTNIQPICHGHLLLIFMIKMCSAICLCDIMIYD